MAQLFGSGLAMGCIYGLVALSFVLIYNATSALNFAQGELVMLGAFVGVSLISWKLPYPVVFLLTFVVMGVVGYLYQRLGYYPLRDKPFITFIIATIGASIFLQNLALLVWGATPKAMPSLFETEFVQVLGARLTPENLFIFGVTVALLVLFYGMFFRTAFGRRLRATAENQEVARLMGISVSRTISFTFILSTALAGVAGLLVAPIFLVDIEMGIQLIFKAFVAVVIGGFGSLPGAVVGGLIIGILEILLAAFVSTVYKDALVFTILILFLVFFPQGIFGERVAEKV
ncbi:MAG: branched-chain amino acid ABC transporter permease [Candidatus Tectomicrobia bacterium]|nr:branched-chain amino acid ABC transporter permease [Candidatus Tectomicrobia bacterium]